MADLAQTWPRVSLHTTERIMPSYSTLLLICYDPKLTPGTPYRSNLAQAFDCISIRQFVGVSHCVQFHPGAGSRKPEPEPAEPELEAGAVAFYVSSGAV